MTLRTYLLLFTIVFLQISCVKDTDFDQVDELVFTPELELDLIHFNMDAGEFYDTTTNTPRFTVRDTTALEFLDDTNITRSFKKIDFFFDFNNAIPRTFEVEFEFIRTNNSSTYITGTMVNAGTPGSPVQTLFLETVEGEDLISIKRASKVVASVTIPAADAKLAGNLSLQSKATYYIEY